MYENNKEKYTKRKVKSDTCYNRSLNVTVGKEQKRVDTEVWGHKHILRYIRDGTHLKRHKYKHIGHRP